MTSKTLMMTALLGAGLLLAACNTVRGAAADVNSAANCAENTMNNGYCR